MRDTEAAEWLLRLQGDDVPEAEVDAWLDWCHADPRNLEAFDHARSLYDRLRAAGAAVREDFLQLAEEDGARPTMKVRPALRWSLAAITMAAAACGVTLLLWFVRPWSFATVGQEQYHVEHGGQRDITLADQSRVVLASDSTLSAQYSANRRLLKLERGEAYFQVEKEPGRPFVVEAGPLLVTATGTAFNVRRTSRRTVVSVTEGEVEVAIPADATAPMLRLRAGQEAVHSDWPGQRRFGVSAISFLKVQQPGTSFWYVNEPLGSLLEDLNRYLPNPIVVVDEQLSAMSLTSTVDPRRAEAWTQALEAVLPLRASRRDDGSILLEMRQPAAR
jgi:transmembrane sensor